MPCFEPKKASVHSPQGFRVTSASGTSTEGRRTSAYSPRSPEQRAVRYVTSGSDTPRKITFVPTARKVGVVSLQARPCHRSSVSHARSESGVTTCRLNSSYAMRPGPARLQSVPGEAKTAPCTPSPLYRSVQRGSMTPRPASAASSASAPSGGPATLEPSRRRLRPLVLPAWPSTVAWTTFQPGTTPFTGVQRQVSTASVASEISRTGPASSTPRVVTLRSWPRTLSSTTSFRSPSPSPRLYSAPLPSSGSFRVVRATSPPVVHIDLTKETRQAGSKTPAAEMQASSGYHPGRELQRRDPEEAMDAASKTDEEETTDDDSQEDGDERDVEDWSARSLERAKHREDGYLPTAERDRKSVV